MKKYFLVKNDKEVNIGDEISLSVNVNVPKGKAKLVMKVTVTEEMLKQLLEVGYIVEKNVEEKKNEENYSSTLHNIMHKLIPCMMEISKRTNLNAKDTIIYTSCLYDLSKHAHLELLISVFADLSNSEKEVNKSIYYLNPEDGYKPCATNSGSGVIAFNSLNDAKKVYAILQPFIKELLTNE